MQGLCHQGSARSCRAHLNWKGSFVKQPPLGSAGSTQSRALLASVLADGVTSLGRASSAFVSVSPRTQHRSVSVATKVATAEPADTVAQHEALQQQHGPGPLENLPMGVWVYPSQEASIRVWAPHAQTLTLELESGELCHLERRGDTWCGVFPPGVLTHGTRYQLSLVAEDGRQLLRRDPYARQADMETAWCTVDDPNQYKWRSNDWQPLPHADYIIYQLHVGSWTPEGTFTAAMEKLQHVRDLGFTCVQLLPVAQHLDPWGYNPCQPMTLHNAYGTPDEFRAFVDRAHELGLAVIIDVVLHHGAPNGNQLWEYDGWGPDWNGGIYHEHAPDTPWGRAWAFWKGEVTDMLVAVCCSWLGAFRCDGLRFDSANDLPHDFIRNVTWQLHDKFPGRLLSAEVTPENPAAVHDLGFDSLWVHSGYFDIIQQHRALGRGHHGGGDWAEGWNLPRLRTAMGLHPGFSAPSQCIKYILGSHDQCGDQHGGKWYEDYAMVGGRHRYSSDQFGGGRSDPHAMMATRAWWCAGVGAAGLPMMFMGTEWAQPGWWHTDPDHRPNWELTKDAVGQQTMALVGAMNKLRFALPALRHGWANILHEDRANGVLAFERVAEGVDKVVIVVNAGRAHWQGGEYGVWVGGSGGTFQEVLNSQDVQFGGWEGWKSNVERGPLQMHDGKLWINLPPQCTLVFKSVPV